jgi:hypothetical protein
VARHGVLFPVSGSVPAVDCAHPDGLWLHGCHAVHCVHTCVETHAVVVAAFPGGGHMRHCWSVAPISFPPPVPSLILTCACVRAAASFFNGFADALNLRRIAGDILPAYVIPYDAVARTGRSFSVLVLRYRVSCSPACVSLSSWAPCVCVCHQLRSLWRHFVVNRCVVGA